MFHSPESGISVDVAIDLSEFLNKNRVVSKYINIPCQTSIFIEKVRCLKNELFSIPIVAENKSSTICSFKHPL